MVAAARAFLVDGHATADEHGDAPLSVLAERLANVPALFAPVERGTAVIETDIGRQLDPTEPPSFILSFGHSWAPDKFARRLRV